MVSQSDKPSKTEIRASESYFKKCEPLHIFFYPHHHVISDVFFFKKEEDNSVIGGGREGTRCYVDAECSGTFL